MEFLILQMIALVLVCSFGLLEGLVRKRGAIGTVVNVVVACVSGFGTLYGLAFVINSVGYPADGSITYPVFLSFFFLVPILGAMVGIWAILRHFRRERRPTLRETIFVVVAFPVAAILTLGSLNFVYGLLSGFARKL